MRYPNEQHCGNVPHRVSPPHVWPLRGLDGRTWAERGGFVTQAMVNRHGSYAAARAARKAGV